MFQRAKENEEGSITSHIRVNSLFFYPFSWCKHRNNQVLLLLRKSWKPTWFPSFSQRESTYWLTERKLSAAYGIQSRILLLGRLRGSQLDLAFRFRRRGEAEVSSAGVHTFLTHEKSSQFWSSNVSDKDEWILGWVSAFKEGDHVSLVSDFRFFGLPGGIIFIFTDNQECINIVCVGTGFEPVTKVVKSICCDVWQDSQGIYQTE